MPDPVVLLNSISAALSRAGFKSRVRRLPGHFRIEVDTNETFREERWAALIAALEQGDRFGLEASATGAVAWALVAHAPPSGADR